MENTRDRRYLFNQSMSVYAARLIAQHANINDKFKIVSYKPGFDDEKIAELLAKHDGAPVDADKVRAFRRKNIGKLSEERTTPKVAQSLTDRLDELENRITQLEDQVSAPNLAFPANGSHANNKLARA